MAKEKYSAHEEYRIHRPNNKGTGSATSFQMTLIETKLEKVSYRDVSVFLTMVPQIKNDEAGNNKFGWKDEKRRLIMKLDMNDLGELLSVLNGVKKKVGPLSKDTGLFHQSPKGNSILGFEKTTSSKGGDPVYRMALSVKRGDDVQKFLQYLSAADGEILKELFSMAVRAQFKWDSLGAVD